MQFVCSNAVSNLEAGRQLPCERLFLCDASLSTASSSAAGAVKQYLEAFLHEAQAMSRGGICGDARI